ncbi:Hypothetical protein SMAX5B_021316 [Scomber scombrus]|uniref:Uncharacterized protein n=1 Tax=Scomber scombrus TaxID=13677 RepID=A0AAV1PGM7_SCOSC
MIASLGDDRLCLSCSDGRVLGFDLHTRCEVCLGAQHTGLALTPRSSCPYCTLLRPEEKQRRVDFFTTAADDFWPLREKYSVEEALGILDPPDVSDSDESPHSGFSVPSLFQSEELEHAEGGCAIPGEPGIPSPLATALPSIVDWSKSCRISFSMRPLAEQEAASSDEMCSVFPLDQPRCCVALLPAHLEVPRGRCGGSEGSEGTCLNICAHHQSCWFQRPRFPRCTSVGG